MPQRKSSFAINVLATMQDGKGIAEAPIKCEFGQDLILVQIITRAQKYRDSRSITGW